MKKFLALAMSALLLLLSLASCAANMGDPDAIEDYTPEVDYLITDKGTFYFEEAEGESAILVDYKGKATKDDHVVIPEKFNDRTVTGIGDEAFYNLSALVEVTIPATVETIGKFAFASCTELTTINLPAGTLAIDDYAFARCEKLAKVDLGDALVSIGDKAFWACPKLADVELPATLTTIGEGAFANCTALPSLVIPASVTAIGDLAYYNCTGLQSIKLHDGIEDLGKFIFSTEGSSLKAMIDTSNLAEDSEVLKYVNEMADTIFESAEETEAETDPDEA